MTVTLWNKIQAKMLPTPAKFHYLFNMRELSKVFQGIILATRDRCVTGLPVASCMFSSPLQKTTSVLPSLCSQGVWCFTLH